MMTIITRGANVDTDDMNDTGSLSQTDSNSLASFTGPWRFSFSVFILSGKLQTGQQLRLSCP